MLLLDILPLSHVQIFCLGRSVTPRLALALDLNRQYVNVEGNEVAYAESARTKLLVTEPKASYLSVTKPAIRHYSEPVTSTFPTSFFWDLS